jgi:hypothetical protein
MGKVSSQKSSSGSRIRAIGNWTRNRFNVLWKINMI